MPRAVYLVGSVPLTNGEAVPPRGDKLEALDVIDGRHTSLVVCMLAPVNPPAAYFRLIGIREIDGKPASEVLDLSQSQFKQPS